MKIKHGFEPVYDENSRILILGTMPSVSSRKKGFYYMHPANLFWGMLSGLLHREHPETIDDKKKLLLENRIALWDVLAECEIKASSDSSISAAVPNDLSRIFETSNISAVYANGRKAEELYKRFNGSKYGLPVYYLPSTSPANRRYYDHAQILERWSVILEAI